MNLISFITQDFKGKTLHLEKAVVQLDYHDLHVCKL